jgi:hypothetical protein
MHSASGQSRWTNIYHDEWDAPMLFISGSYDHGYLVSGRHQPNFPKYNWLIKTDINGQQIWEKMIGNGMNSIVLIEMATNDLGNIFSCGTTTNYDDNGDPIVMKLNPCGEKEWCKILHRRILLNRFCLVQLRSQYSSGL